MKYLHTISYILMLIISTSCFQKPLKRLQNPAHQLDSLYTWDVEESDKDSQMFMDIPYQPCDTCEAEYLTLSVAKNKSEERPRWISIILPCDEDQLEDTLAHPKYVLFIFLKKAGTDSLQWKNDLLKNDLPGFYIGKCKDETYTFRMMAGYGKELYGNGSVDVFRKFMEFDQVNFYIYYSGGSEKVVKIPLKSFQKQYDALI
jgi:hypothetical protein